MTSPNAENRVVEHWPCGADGCPEKPWHAMFTGLLETVAEEAETLRALVRDPDSACPARAMRQERLAALEWVLNLGDTLGRWEW